MTEPIDSGQCVCTAKLGEFVVGGRYRFTLEKTGLGDRSYRVYYRDGDGGRCFQLGVQMFPRFFRIIEE